MAVAQLNYPKMATTINSKLECCQVHLDDQRVVINVPSTSGGGWTCLSWAIWNGGYRVFDKPLRVLNCKVPAEYDGVTPNPRQLCQEFVRRENHQRPDDEVESVVLLTAASMKTSRMASRSAGYSGGTSSTKRVVVDAVVTAGISNSRVAGASADWFGFRNDSSAKEAGTINTVVVTNASLESSTLLEAHGIAVEAKCAACIDLGIACAKTGRIAQGTGTDTTCILAPNKTDFEVTCAGKHTLFGELVGQAVYDATREALLTNIHYMYGSRFRYFLHRVILKAKFALRGSRPMVPPKPMTPIPRPPATVTMIGALGLILAYVMHLQLPRDCSRYSHPASLLLAVFSWDRYLGSVPLLIHPVVLVGKLTRSLIWLTPDRILDMQVIGFLSGLLMMLAVIFVSIAASWGLLLATELGSTYAWQSVSELTLNTSLSFVLLHCIRFIPWLTQVMLVQSSISLQLLCTVALQMAHFLERRQLTEARLQLSWLCSRDSSRLSPDDLAGATLESLSENLSDSVVAPLFWYIVCGPLGAVAFRVVNTLDSCVGFRGRYEWYGKASARLDDVLCIVPARLTAVLLAVAALAVPGCQPPMTALSVAWREAMQCDSPNAGWPMGTMAGLLHTRLEKKGQYCLQATGVAPGPYQIRRGHQVAQLAGYLSVALCIAATTSMSTYS